MSMAIKYSMMKNQKKMAEGGPCDQHGTHMCKMCHGGQYSKGGDVDRMREHSDDRMISHDSDDLDPEPMPKDYESQESEYAAENQESPEDEGDDMIGRIMKQRQSFSEGGRVANRNRTGEHADMEPDEFDDLVKDDHLEEHYTGENSGDELGDDQEDEDRHDMVARIMKSRRLKDRNPRPA